MIEQRIKKGPITKKSYWFSKSPKKEIISTYMQSSSGEEVKGMNRTSFFTLHIDLNKDIEEIKSGFDKGTAYEVRRAAKDGIDCNDSNDLDAFINFYNAFAKAKGIEGTTKRYNDFNKPLDITFASFEGEVLVMHSYLNDGNRARLFMSSSKYLEEADSKKRALLGRANRLLHLHDIEKFKASGLKIYDLGGYAKDTTDKFLIGINNFKAGFGGELVEEFNYEPSWR